MPARARPVPMNVALQKPLTILGFLAWAERQEERYEFDGSEPVAMTGGSARHNRIMGNVHATLRTRLRGTGCDYYGPDLGVQTTGSKVRYPDALITCTKFPDSEKLAPNVVVVFEVISPGSDRTDRIEKVREYAAIGSVRRYVILESASIGLTVLERNAADETWRIGVLTTDDILAMPEIGIEIPVAALYEAVAFDDTEQLPPA